jgi:hypothetical protein
MTDEVNKSRLENEDVVTGTNRSVNAPPDFLGNEDSLCKTVCLVFLIFLLFAILTFALFFYHFGPNSITLLLANHSIYLILF